MLFLKTNKKNHQKKFDTPFLLLEQFAISLIYNFYYCSFCHFVRANRAHLANDRFFRGLFRIDVRRRGFFLRGQGADRLDACHRSEGNNFRGCRQRTVQQRAPCKRQHR